jgi:hypothetical protein
VSVTYPLFVFEKDDKSIRLIENESRILYHLEAIDIENEEYVFWDSSGSGVLVTVTPIRIFKQGKLDKVASCQADFPVQDAFKAYATSLGLPEAVAEGAPTEAWGRIQQELAGRPKKRGFVSRLFAGKE